jgi:hypothetical protein
MRHAGAQHVAISAISSPRLSNRCAVWTACYHSCER